MLPLGAEIERKMDRLGNSEDWLKNPSGVCVSRFLQGHHEWYLHLITDSHMQRYNFALIIAKMFLIFQSFFIPAPVFCVLCVCVLTAWSEPLSWPSVRVAGCGTRPWWATAAGPGCHPLYSLPEQSRISVTMETVPSVWSLHNHMRTYFYGTHGDSHIPSDILLSWQVALWCTALVRGVTAREYWWPGGCSYRNLPGRHAGTLGDA